MGNVNCGCKGFMQDMDINILKSKLENNNKKSINNINIKLKKHNNFSIENKNKNSINSFDLSNILKESKIKNNNINSNLDLLIEEKVLKNNKFSFLVANTFNQDTSSIKNKNNTHSFIDNKTTKFKLKEPPDNFIEEIFEQINLLRSKPYIYSQKILNSLGYIKSTNKSNDNIDIKNNKHISDNSNNEYCSNYFSYYVKQDICKIGLIKGQRAFVETAELLAIQDSIDLLIFKKDLCIEIPDNKSEWINKTYLETYLQEKAKNLNYSKFGFHFDLNCVCPETSVILQVVDDNTFNLQRRNNILNPEYKYIGISSKKINNNYCVYLTFAS